MFCWDVCVVVFVYRVLLLVGCWFGCFFLGLHVCLMFLLLGLLSSCRVCSLACLCVFMFLLSCWFCNLFVVFLLFAVVVVIVDCLLVCCLTCMVSIACLYYLIC